MYVLNWEKLLSIKAISIIQTSLLVLLSLLFFVNFKMFAYLRIRVGVRRGRERGIERRRSCPLLHLAAKAATSIPVSYMGDRTHYLEPTLWPLRVDISSKVESGTRASTLLKDARILTASQGAHLALCSAWSFRLGCSASSGPWRVIEILVPYGVRNDIFQRLYHHLETSILFLHRQSLSLGFWIFAFN